MKANYSQAESVVPWDEIAANEYTVAAYTRRGGHLGWFRRGQDRWFVQAVGDFFEVIDKKVCPEKVASLSEGASQTA